MTALSLSPNEDRDIKEFKLKHCSCRNRHRSSHQYSYIVTPTGIGYALEIKCNRCGEIKDVTDYDTW